MTSLKGDEIIMFKLKKLKLIIAIKLTNLLLMLIKLFLIVLLGLIYLIIFGGVLAIFAIPIALLFKLI